MPHKHTEIDCSQTLVFCSKCRCVKRGHEEFILKNANRDDIIKVHTLWLLSFDFSIWSICRFASLTKGVTNDLQSGTVLQWHHIITVFSPLWFGLFRHIYLCTDSVTIYIQSPVYWFVEIMLIHMYGSVRLCSFWWYWIWMCYMKRLTTIGVNWLEKFWETFQLGILDNWWGFGAYVWQLCRIRHVKMCLIEISLTTKWIQYLMHLL